MLSKRKNNRKSNRNRNRKSTRKFGSGPKWSTPASDQEIPAWSDAADGAFGLPPEEHDQWGLMKML